MNLKKKEEPINTTKQYEGKQLKKGWSSREITAENARETCREANSTKKIKITTQKKKDAVKNHKPEETGTHCSLFFHDQNGKNTQNHKGFRIAIVKIQ